jgi:uncharacterized protein YcbX
VSADAIGTIKTLRRYPVKSMAGEDLATARVTYAGVQGDRVYAFIDSAPTRPSFPWYSARQRHDLVLFEPRFRAPPADALPPREAFAVDVRTPTGAVLPIDAPELLASLRERAGRDVALRFSERGMHDSRPVLIFGLATAAAIAERAGTPVEPLRFRANVYVDWRDPTPFFEDGLVGRRLKLGEQVEVLIEKRDTRCVVVDVDPATGVAAPGTLRSVATMNRGTAGVYAVVVREGLVHAGDPIRLVE